jgi:hypothetical protein
MQYYSERFTVLLVTGTVDAGAVFKSDHTGNIYYFVPRQHADSRKINGTMTSPNGSL